MNIDQEIDDLIVRALRYARRGRVSLRRVHQEHPTAIIVVGAEGSMLVQTYRLGRPWKPWPEQFRCDRLMLGFGDLARRGFELHGSLVAAALASGHDVAGAMKIADEAVAAVYAREDEGQR
jgi:hypothetical protein